MPRFRQALATLHLLGSEPQEGGSSAFWAFQAHSGNRFRFAKSSSNLLWCSLQPYLQWCDLTEDKLTRSEDCLFRAWQRSEARCLLPACFPAALLHPSCSWPVLRGVSGWHLKRRVFGRVRRVAGTDPPHAITASRNLWSLPGRETAMSLCLLRMQMLYLHRPPRVPMELVEILMTYYTLLPHL